VRLGAFQLQEGYDALFSKWLEGGNIRILGIDTGLANLGWAVIEGGKQTSRLISSGVVTTSPRMVLAERLWCIEAALEEVISLGKPDMMAYEELFFNPKHPSMMKTNLSVGIVMCVGWRHGLSPKSFRPQDAKHLLTRSPAASKEDVARSVGLYLGVDLSNKVKDHATDAMAHALCYFSFLKLDFLERASRKAR